MEEIIDLRLKGLRLLQNPQFFGFSEDSVRLCEFAAKNAADCCKICELGSGNGGLLLALWARLSHADLVGVEVMSANVALAERSLALNSEVGGIKEHCRFICADWRDWQQHFAAASFDLVVSNPPFWQENSGRLSHVPERRAATHELHGTLVEMLTVAAEILVSGGKLCLLLPSERGIEALNDLQTGGFSVKITENFAKRVLILAQKY